jgi:hypothetical protein
MNKSLIITLLHSTILQNWQPTLVQQKNYTSGKSAFYDFLYIKGLENYSDKKTH